jgi:hypothetical protein
MQNLKKARFIGEWIEFDTTVILISCKWFKNYQNKRKLIQNFYGTLEFVNDKGKKKAFI